MSAMVIHHLDSDSACLKIQERTAPGHKVKTLLFALPQLLLLIALGYVLGVMGQGWGANMVGWLAWGCALGLVYYVTVALIDRRQVIITRERVVRRHLPLPWPGSYELDSRNIERVEVVEQPLMPGGGASALRLVAQMRDGEQRSLIQGEIASVDREQLEELARLTRQVIRD